MPATYEPIATNTLGSAAASITFSSIASTYTDLRVVIVATGSAASIGQLRFNGVSTGGTYSSTYLYGNGTSVLSSNRTSRNGGIDFFEGSISTTIPTFSTIDIFSYAGSTYKTCLITGSLDQNGSGQTERIVGLWSSTAAITTVALVGNGMNWAAGTTATLYGIKAA